MQRTPYSTVILNIADIAAYLPDDSAATQAVTVATLAAPAPPRIIGYAPEDSFTPNWTTAKQAARNLAQNKEMQRLLIIAAAVAILIAALGYHFIGNAVAANQAYQSRYAAQYTGWVSSDASTPIAVTVLPCQHAGACTDVQVDITVQDGSHTPHEYRLGGHLLGDHELYVWGTYAGITYTADIVMDHPLQGNITTGTAQMTFKCGAVAVVYQLRSATLQEQTSIFTGK